MTTEQPKVPGPRPADALRPAVPAAVGADPADERPSDVPGRRPATDDASGPAAAAGPAPRAGTPVNDPPTAPTPVNDPPTAPTPVNALPKPRVPVNDPPRPTPSVSDPASPAVATPTPTAAASPAPGPAPAATVGTGTATSDKSSIGSAVRQAAPPQPAAPQQTIAQQPTETPRKKRKPLPNERPPGAPQDPWTAFATTTERQPGRIRRVTRRFLRGFIGEYALVIYAALLLAVALTWPTLRYPLHTLPQDLGEPARQAWQIAWSGHILLTDPIRLWQSNAFYPEPNSFAFSDSLLGYAPAGMLGEGPLAATLRYNILFVLAHALLAIGGYALVRQLGAGRTGAAVAAVAFAYAPWRLAQEGHLDIVSAGGIPLALAMLARGHGWSLRHGWRPARRRAGWAALGWLVAAWQVSLGFSLGLPFLYVLGIFLVTLLVRVPLRWWRWPDEDRSALGWRLLLIDIFGPLVTAGVAGLIAIPYLKAPGGGATREIAFFSPPLRSLLIGPAESRIWGAPHAVARSSLSWPAEMALLPGFVLYALALAGLAFSIWKLWQRLLLVVALAATIILTLGTNFFHGRGTYLPLFGHLPASVGVRVPGRLMLWTTLLLAILAAGAVAELVRRAEHLSRQRIPPWPGPWLRLATMIPLALVLVEGWNSVAHPVVPAQPTAMRTVTGPMLVLPTATLADETVMLWSTSRFQPIANGAGGFAATRQAQLRRNVAAFPDTASIEYLRSLNISTVLLLRSQVAGTPWERAGDVPVDLLGIRREDLDDAVVFRLR